MWNATEKRLHLLTILVIDKKNHHTILAAMSLASRERKSSWKSFFEWVKNVVPAFNPKYIVTDGAFNIDDVFKAAVFGKAFNMRAEEMAEQDVDIAVSKSFERRYQIILFR